MDADSYIAKLRAEVAGFRQAEDDWRQKVKQEQRRLMGEHDRQEEQFHARRSDQEQEELTRLKLAVAEVLSELGALSGVH